MFIGNIRSLTAVVFLTLGFLVTTFANTTTKHTTKKTFNLRRNNVDDKAPHKKIDTGINDTNEWLFKDYLKKFRPMHVWERLYQKKKAQGLNVSIDKNYEELMEGIDESEEILRIKLDVGASGRRAKWSPPGHLDMTNKEGALRDRFSIRRRFYELILHTIYWTRNKMINMQTTRKEYRGSKLYKMGYMMSKTDVACKLFHGFTFKALTTCIAVRDSKDLRQQYRYYPIDSMHVEERMLNKWMDIIFLTELIEKNDKSCKEMLPKTSRDREEKWKFYD